MKNIIFRLWGRLVVHKKALPYANLFMDRLERKLLSQAQVKLYIWSRYIDDVFMVWTGSELELVEFLNYINKPMTRLSSLGTGLERGLITWMFR